MSEIHSGATQKSCTSLATNCPNLLTHDTLRVADLYVRSVQRDAVQHRKVLDLGAGWAATRMQAQLAHNCRFRVYHNEI